MQAKPSRSDVWDTPVTQHAMNFDQTVHLMNGADRAHRILNSGSDILHATYIFIRSARMASIVEVRVSVNR